MKKITLVLLVVMMSQVGWTQGKLINSYFDEYAEDETFTKVNISNKMFSLFADIDPENESEKEVLEAMKKIEGMKILAAEVVANPDEMYQSALKDIKKGGYEELMSVRDAEENITFVIKEDGGEIQELLMLLGGNEKFIMMSVYGIIDLNSLSKLARKMDIDGMEELSRIKDAKPDN